MSKEFSVKIESTVMDISLESGGPRGYSAYEIWLQAGNEGTVQDFINSLKSETYIYEQILSSKKWEIEHKLDRYPSVTIVDTGGNVVMGDVKYIDTNNIEINFNFEFSGTIYLN